MGLEITYVQDGALFVYRKYVGFAYKIWNSNGLVFSY